MLYSWLAETDDHRFKRAFERYFRAALAHLTQYLARRSSLSDLDSEQVAVDALLTFFSRIGRERRDSSRAVATALESLEPVDLTAFHARLVRSWVRRSTKCRQACMSFTLTPDEEDAGWKVRLVELNGHIPPLVRQGENLIEGERVAAGDGKAFTVHLPLQQFVHQAGIVVECLPKLRVPTSGYLFDIAKNLYLDECKARGRKKRGGTGYMASMPRHPLALEETDTLDEYIDDSVLGPRSVVDEVASPAGAWDVAAEDVDEDFCEQFYAYLRRPLQDAEEAYRVAAARGSGVAERKRLESLSQKSERLMTVLALRVEGHTQEEIATQLGISRNQVKYVIELVQASYAQFSNLILRARPQ